MTRPPDRRTFLARAGLATGALAALGSAACRDAADSAAEAVRTGAPPSVLTPEEFRTFEALADRILPADGDAPGARDLGAVTFIDRFLARDEETLGGARAALAVLDESAPGFADLAPDAQDQVVGAFEEHPSGLFGLVHFRVVAGAFAAPAHGGNRDGAGWALLGYEPRHVWQAPFGAYDGPAAGAGE